MASPASPAGDGPALTSFGRPQAKGRARDALDVGRLHMMTSFAANLNVDVRAASAVSRVHGGPSGSARYRSPHCISPITAGTRSMPMGVI